MMTYCRKSPLCVYSWSLLDHWVHPLDHKFWPNPAKCQQWCHCWHFMDLVEILFNQLISSDVRCYKNKKKNQNWTIFYFSFQVMTICLISKAQELCHLCECIGNLQFLISVWLEDWFLEFEFWFWVLSLSFQLSLTFLQRWHSSFTKPEHDVCAVEALEEWRGGLV